MLTLKVYFCLYSLVQVKALFVANQITLPVVTWWHDAELSTNSLTNVGSVIQGNKMSFSMFIHMVRAHNNLTHITKL
jgi:hypothetical protein